jgi:hypothetical protein
MASERRPGQWRRRRHRAAGSLRSGFLRRVDGVRGAELFGELQLVLGDVYGDDSRSGDLCVLHGQMSEPADAEHGDEVGRPGTRYFHRLVGRHTGTRQRRGVERVDPVRDASHESSVRPYVLGITAVDEVPRVLLAPTQRLPAGRAVLAGPAGPTEPRHGDPIAETDAGHVAADPFDDAHTFMAWDEGQRWLDGPVAAGGMDVRVAQAGRLDPDEELVSTGFGHRDVLDPQRLVEVVDKCGLQGRSP